MSTYLIRIAVCVLIGAWLCSTGVTMLHESVFTSQLMGTVMLGCGLLVIIYGFSPGVASAVISAIVKIISLPFKAL